MPMDRLTLVNGQITSKWELENTCGRTVTCIKEVLYRKSEMARAFMPGEMERKWKDGGEPISLMGMPNF